MDARAFVVERWRKSGAKRIQKFGTAAMIAVLIFVGGTVLFAEGLPLARLAVDATCKAPTAVARGACTVQKMTIVRAYIFYGRRVTHQIVLRSAHGAIYDVGLHGAAALSVYQGALRHTDRVALMESLDDRPIAVDTASGHATLSGYPDWLAVALGVLMICAAIAWTLVGP